MEQSTVITRAKAQKLNNVNKSVTKSTDEYKRSVREKRSACARDDSEASIGPGTRKKSLDAKVTVDKSRKRRACVNQKLNMVEQSPRSRNKADRGENASSNELKKILRDKHTDNDVSQCANSGDLSKAPRKRQEQDITVASTKEQSDMVTPKSTPIKLSFTPHRSTKTPKKSPISLSSPKTHSASVPKLLKTPRKLSLTPCENLHQYNDNSRDGKSRKVKNDGLRDVSTSNMNSPASPVVKNARGRPIVKLKGIAHRFSKSPKIVLRSPSRKSKSPTFNTYARRKGPSKKSPAKSSRAGAKNSRMQSDNKNSPADKRRSLNSRVAKLLTASQMRDVLAEPIVLLKKLSLESCRKLDISITAHDDDQLVDCNRWTDAENDTPAAGSNNASARLRGSSRRKSAAKETSESTGKLSPTRRESKISTALVSSTPLEEKTAPLPSPSPSPSPSLRVPRVTGSMSDTSMLSAVQGDAAYPSTRSRCTSQSGAQAAPSPFSPKDKSVIENVPKPSLLNVDDTDGISRTRVGNAAQQDTTYEVKDQNGRGNVTYELKEPQTPSLRQMIRKRNATDANLSANENAKKSCRVRFANVAPDDTGARNPIDKSVGDRQSGVTGRNSGEQKNIIIMNSARKSRKAEIFKFSRDSSLASPLNTKPSPRTGRATPRGRLHSLNVASLNLNKVRATPETGVESAEKKSEKRSSVKKVPNFRRIHEKMFAKSESVVDAKKRLESRHLDFAATRKVLSEMDAKKGMKLLPGDTNNGPYNRFGFKLRKAEATHIIMKKQTVFSRQKQQHETRTVLKSVRTNRRFELQMKKIRDLSPSEYRQVRNSKHIWVVEFYVPRCGHCQKMEPQLAIAAQLVEKVRFGRMNCNFYMHDCVEANIQVFPTLMLYKQRENSYDGFKVSGMTAETIKDEILEIINSRMKHDEL